MSAKDAESPGGVFSRLRRRLTTTQSETEANELLAETLEAGATPLRDCQVGERAVVSGTVRSVTLRPRGRVPALEAEIYDGTGRLSAVWMGRRRIRGIDPGRMIALTGRVNDVQGRPTMFNPRYELRPGSSQ